MMKDDDQLTAYDLSAWDVPPPAPGLVDAVIARARQPAPVAALDTGDGVGGPVRRKRRWWIAATASAVAIAGILVGVSGIQRTPNDGHGEVIAASARTLAIGPTTAALDPGAEVRWRRDKRRISVAQPNGTALWNVAVEDTLVIDAGAMVATVEASGASLRVEVKMINASDARAVGISAATALAVALVTIVVYEGTVRVRHEGQTVNVVPGMHYEVRPAPTPPPTPEPAPTPFDFSTPAPIAVSGGPVDPRIRELEDRIKQLQAERDALDPNSRAKATCDEVSCVLNNHAGACCARFKRTWPSGLRDGLDRKTISDAMRAVKVKILECPTGGFTGTVNVKALVAGDGTVSAVASATPPMAVPAPLASCITDLVHSAKFPATVNGGSFGYPFVFEAVATAPVAPAEKDRCDEVSCVLNNYAGPCCLKFKSGRTALDKKPPAEKGRCDEMSCVLHNDAGACCAKFKKGSSPTPSGLPDTLDRTTISAAIAMVTGKIYACPVGGFVGTVKVKVVVAPDGRVTKAAATASAFTSPNGLPATLGSCIEVHMRSAPFPRTVSGGSFGYPFVYGADTAVCDADALRQKGDDHLSTGMDAAALAAFETSFACKADSSVSRKAYMAACRSNNAAKARKYFAMVPASQRDMLAQICIRMGIALDDEPETATGVIKVASNPPAKLLLDGVDTGKTTPATLQATAGKHKITFQIGGDKYTFAVTVKAGETMMLTKELR